MNPLPERLYFVDAPRLFARLSVADLPSALRREVKALGRSDDRFAARFLIHATLLVVGACVALGTVTPLSRALGGSLEVVGLIGLSIGLHEASHWRLLSARWANELAGLCCGIPLLIPLTAFRTNHRDHHRRRGSGGHETPEVLDFALLRSLPVYCLGIALKSFGFITVLPVLSCAKARSWTRLRMIAEYTLLGVLLWAAQRLVPWAEVIRIWLLPLALTALFSQVRAVAEHGLTRKGNVFTASRTVRSNPVVSFLMCNINYHLEHHLWPSLPWYRLPAVHRLLLSEYERTGASVYGSYHEFFADFLRATWQGICPEARLIAGPARDRTPLL